MKRPLLLLFVLLTGLSTSAQLAQPLNTEGLPAQATRTAALPPTPSTATITHQIVDAPNGTYGYEILADGKLLVRQRNVPGQPGNTGCGTKADAEKLAALVADKVKRGEMPPTVTKEELHHLNIIR